MPQTRNKKQMTAALKRVRADIASLTDWFECELERYDDEALAGDFTWSDVGTLQKVRSDLMETLAFFSGFNRNEIQRNLDEQHSEL